MRLEVLAPVGDEGGVDVAINSGANAVYFGLPMFNARAKASNITLENLKEIVKRCHIFDVKVYVTINTIIKDAEVDDFLKLVEFAIECKVDAFIIQDFGMAYLLSNTFKNIELHASTQMGVHNLKGAKMLENLGISRAVLSRETKLEDIIEIKNNTNLEIEYFVQGALCVAFSGNCYISSLNKNKSGNRGECLQYCRLKYSATKNDELIKQGYLLSASDLCLVKNINTLIDAGVTSFKIEGRLRRYGYIAQSIKTYTEIINNINYKNLDEEVYKLKKVFNRGEYNDGYYLKQEPNKKTINYNFQNHRGVKVGKVISVKPFKTLYEITLQSSKKLSANDGLKFVLDGNEISIGVGNVVVLKPNIYKIYSTKKPLENSDVYLTVDAENEKMLLQQTRLLNVKVFAEFEEYKLPKIVLECGNIKVQVLGDNILEPAKNSPLSVKDVLDTFNKTDTFPYKVDTICFVSGVFMSKYMLNELRRKCFANLYEAINNGYIAKNLRPITKVEFTNKEPLCDNNFSYCITDKYVDEIKNFDKVVFAPSVFNINTIKQFYEKYNNKFYLYLPTICNYFDMQIIDQILKEFDNNKIGLVANNLWGLSFADRYEVIGGYFLNIANKYAGLFLNSLKINSFIKSIEPSLNNSFNCGLKYLGNVSVMTLAHCPYKTIYDYNGCNNCNFDNKLNYILEDGKEYKIRRIKVSNCYFELVDNVEYNQNLKGFVTDIR